jgi:hypothetical protein
MRIKERLERGKEGIKENSRRDVGGEMRRNEEEKTRTMTSATEQVSARLTQHTVLVQCLGEPVRGVEDQRTSQWNINSDDDL